MPASRLRQPPHRRATNGIPPLSLQAEPLVGGVSLFGAIGFATACIMGVSLFRDIKYSEHSPEDR